MTRVINKPRVGWIAVLAILVLLLGVGAFAFIGRQTTSLTALIDRFSLAENFRQFGGWSDLLVGLSYLSVSATLVYLAVRAGRDLRIHWLILALALLILAFAATHLMEVWNLNATDPPYRDPGWIKRLAAIASICTALLLPPLVPKILGVLRAANQESARQHELENAYAELSELYRKATQPAPRKERISSILDLRGSQKPEGLAEIAREVSEHARQLEHAKHAAEDANRAKDQFLAVLSHELRTPLTPALAAASDLEAAYDIEPGELREALSLIRRNIELEARLVDDLLDLTRITKGKLQVQFSTVDLHQTIQHATEMCRTEAKVPCSNLSVHLDATAYHVRGDAARLAQVFWNLILNAVKFTPTEGSVTIRSTNPQPNRVRIEVTDTGIGIAADKLTRIFEPFQQGEESTTRRYGGLGLGLSVAKGLMDAHGGTITAYSEGVNLGTTFIVEMSTTTPSLQSKSDPAVRPAVTGRSLRVLVVEDHADTRQALCRILSRWGHTVQAAGTVAEAEAAVSRFRPELLLSDIGLPDGTGVELLEKLRNHYSCVAIAMSGYGMESDLEQTRRAGFKAHLVKPVAAERLKDAIETLTADDLLPRV
jgi:signal transduction histidine kinase